MIEFAPASPRSVWAPAISRRAISGAALLAVLAAACASPGQRMAVDVPAGRAPTASDRVAREVGRLLSGDAAASRAGERSLLSLDAAGRAALAAHAQSIPAERDRRWLHVLDGNGLLPPISTAEAVELRLWQASRGEPALLMKAQAALVELAEKDPAALAARLAAPSPGRDLVALALGTAKARTAAPALLSLYGGASTVAERRASSEALARILGEGSRPRADASEAERAAEVARIRPAVEAAARAKEDVHATP